MGWKKNERKKNVLKIELITYFPKLGRPGTHPIIIIIFNNYDLVFCSGIQSEENH